jgi:hypothetical protein
MSRNSLIRGFTGDLRRCFNMAKLFTTAQAVEMTGFDRSALLRAENRGDLGVVARTGGGHRRYTRVQIEAMGHVDVQAARDEPAGHDVRPGRTGLQYRNYRELGTTGLTRFGGQVWEEKIKELVGRDGRRQYREMRLNSPVVAAVFTGIISAMKEPSRRVIPASDSEADREAAEFVDSCFDDMSFSWKDTLDLVLNPFLEQGFAVPEIIYKKRLGKRPPPYLPEHRLPLDSPGHEAPSPSLHDDGREGWRKWASRPAETLADGQEWIFDAYGGVRGINQASDVIGGQVDPLVPENVMLEDGGDVAQVYSIPIEKLLHFRTTTHPGNNPEGLSILRPGYVPYYYTTQLMEIEGIGAERDLSGVPVIYLGEGTTLGNDPDSDWSMSQYIVHSLRSDEQTGVVFPHQKLDSQGRGILLELLSTGGRRAWDVGSIIERHEKRITLSVLAQFLMLGMEQVGSYALSRHHGDLFVLAVQAFMDTISGVINRHAITRLIDMNVFPGLTGYPVLAFSPVGIPKLDEVGEFVNRLAERELLTPDPELERHLRQLGGLPQPSYSMDAKPATESEQVRDAEKTALLLRRISLAVEPLEELGALAPGEGAALLTPLVNELRTSLGGDSSPALADGFEEAVEAAKARLTLESDGEEVNLEKAVKRYVAGVLGKHAPDGTEAVTCPACCNVGAYVYKEEGGDLHVCMACGSTFNLVAT